MYKNQYIYYFIVSACLTVKVPADKDKIKTVLVSNVNIYLYAVCIYCMLTLC